MAHEQSKHCRRRPLARDLAETGSTPVCSFDSHRCSRSCSTDVDIFLFPAPYVSPVAGTCHAALTEDTSLARPVLCVCVLQTLRAPDCSRSRFAHAIATLAASAGTNGRTTFKCTMPFLDDEFGARIVWPDPSRTQWISCTLDVPPPTGVGMLLARTRMRAFLCSPLHDGLLNTNCTTHLPYVPT